MDSRLESGDYLTRAKARTEWMRERPCLVVGNREQGHLFIIRQALHILFFTPAFYPPQQATLLLDNCKYWLRAWGSGLTPEYAIRIDWTSEQNILEALWHLQKEPWEWNNSPDIMQRTGHEQVASRGLSGAPELATAALVGIKASDRFWWQTFTQGIPNTPLQSVKAIRSEGRPLGFCVANDLPPDILYNLPYRASVVKQALRTLQGYPIEIREEGIGDVRALLGSPSASI